MRRSRRVRPGWKVLSGSAIEAAMRHPRVEAGERVLEDDLQVLARRRSSSRRDSSPRFSPSQVTLPWLGGMSCSTARARVDLPQPLSPTMPTVSPGATSKLTPSTALQRDGLGKDAAAHLHGEVDADVAHLEDLALAADGGGLVRAVDAGHRVDQHAGVGVAGGVEDLVDVPLLDVLAGAHDADPVAHPGDHAHVVGDERDRRALLAAGGPPSGRGSRPAR